MTENKIYVLTRYTIFRFVRYMLLAQLFCKTKVIANLQIEAGQNFYENVWIRRSSYCFIHRFFLQINYILVFRVHHKLQNIILHHLLNFHLKEMFIFQENNYFYEMIRRS
jgi:hypothetical protein